MKTKTTRRLVAALCLFAPFGKLRAFGLLAALSLFACALPARAVTITFGPQHCATFLDLCIDMTAPGTGSLTDNGWLIRWEVITFNSYGTLMITMPVDLQAGGYFWRVNTEHLPSLPPFASLYDGRKFVPYNWDGAAPVATLLSPTSYHITQSIQNTPDGGSTFALLGIALGCVLGVHRRSGQRERA